jgi:rare lipoprotein A
MITRLNLVLAVSLQAALWSAAGVADKAPDECGVASVYSTVSEETASGEDTQAENFTAAHRSLPFGTLVHINNQDNGRSTVVRITDRGPFAHGRVIDLSQIAARALAVTDLARVCLIIVIVPENPDGDVK